MRIEDHCGTVTPVVSFPHDSVLVLVVNPLPIALRTGGSASRPIPANAPAATTTSYSRQKMLCFSASKFAIALHAATFGSVTLLNRSRISRSRKLVLRAGLPQ